MFDRSPARFVAPLALAGAVVAIVLVVKGSRPGSSASTVTNTTTTSVRTTPHHHRPRHKYYVVKPGDLLSTIAQRHGLTTKEIQELNPNLDPQALQAGQRVRLR